MLSLYFTLGGAITVNWGFLLLRIAIGLSILTLLFLSQRFWYRALWRVTSHWGRVTLRVGARLAYIVLLLLTIVTLSQGLVFGRGAFARQSSTMTMITGLWFFSALFAYLAVKTVHGLERIWHLLHAAAVKNTLVPQSAAPGSSNTIAETVADPGRRYFSAPPLLPPALLHFSPPCTVSRPNASTTRSAASKSPCTICRLLSTA